MASHCLTALATPEQQEIEALALRLIEASPVRKARETARADLLLDPVVQTVEGRQGMERALDQWVLALAMREANSDPTRPAFIWNVDNTPRRWFGHVYPGAAVAVDNPDNVNRETPIDGSSTYEITGRFAEHRSANFSLKLEEEPAQNAGIGRHVFMLTGDQIVADEDGGFVITVSNDPAAGRCNHIESCSGRLTLYARDSFADWTQGATSLSIRRTSGPRRTAKRSERRAALDIAESLPPFVRYWSHFKNSFLGPPAPNTIVGPIGREASWGFLAGGRFQLMDDEALVVTVTDAGARYTGFQVADRWTIAPDTRYRQSSLNSTQRVRNPDGSTTYVVALLDPGVHNWIDTAGLHEGWFLLRWQGLPAGAQASDLRLMTAKSTLSVLHENLPAGCPAADLASRARQVAARAKLYDSRSLESSRTGP